MSCEATVAKSHRLVFVHAALIFSEIWAVTINWTVRDRGSYIRFDAHVIYDV